MESSQYYQLLYDIRRIVKEEIQLALATQQLNNPYLPPYVVTVNGQPVAVKMGQGTASGTASEH
jgi:hypothetical protein